MSKINSDRPANRRGFTLVEILLVMLITSILALGINTAYRQAHLVWSDIEKRRPIYHDARLIIENLRQELSGLYFPAALDNREENGRNADDSPFSLFTRPNGTTELTFYTLTSSWKTSWISSRVARVRYSFIREDKEETLLQRFEQLYAGEKRMGNESSSIISTDLAEFVVQVFDTGADSDENSWKQSYDSEDKPPEAVSISLRWATIDGKQDVSFQSYILVPCSSSLF